MSAQSLSFQSLLRDFYGVVTANHDLCSSKQTQLASLLSELRKEPLSPSSTNCEEINSSMQETHSSDGESDSRSYSSSQTAAFSENMFFTFLGGDQQNQHEGDHISSDKIKLRNTFSNPSVFRLVAYAVVINHCQITRICSEVDGSQQFHSSIQQIGHLAMRRLRKAMVAAAYSLKQEGGRKEYSKVRYLCEHLFASMEKDLPNKAEYVRIIFQEFDHFYLDKVQRELSRASQRASNSQTFIDETVSFQNHEEIDSTPQDRLGQALNFMQIRLCVKQPSRMTSIGSRDERIKVVIELQKDRLYRLREIVTLAQGDCL